MVDWRVPNGLDVVVLLGWSKEMMRMPIGGE